MKKKPSKLTPSPQTQLQKYSYRFYISSDVQATDLALIFFLPDTGSVTDFQSGKKNNLYVMHLVSKTQFPA